MSILCSRCIAVVTKRWKCTKLPRKSDKKYYFETYTICKKITTSIISLSSFITHNPILWDSLYRLWEIAATVFHRVSYSCIIYSVYICVCVCILYVRYYTLYTFRSKPKRYLYKININLNLRWACRIELLKHRFYYTSWRKMPPYSMLLFRMLHLLLYIVQCRPTCILSICFTIYFTIYRPRYVWQTYFPSRYISFLFFHCITYCVVFSLIGDICLNRLESASVGHGVTLLFSGITHRLPHTNSARKLRWVHLECLTYIYSEMALEFVSLPIVPHIRRMWNSPKCLCSHHIQDAYLEVSNSRITPQNILIKIVDWDRK